MMSCAITGRSPPIHSANFNSRMYRLKLKFFPSPMKGSPYRHFQNWRAMSANPSNQLPYYLWSIEVQARKMNISATAWQRKSSMHYPGSKDCKSLPGHRPFISRISRYHWLPLQKNSKSLLSWKAVYGSQATGCVFKHSW